MNSVLNYIYTSKMCGNEVTSGSTLHNGDDVIIGTNNIETVRKSLKTASDRNIRVQATKCAFGGIAEFLRIDHRRGAKGQYLTRAIATLVHSRIESMASTDIRDLAEAMESRFSDSRSRGMSLELIARLRDVYYDRQTKNVGLDKEVMYIIKKTHRCAGGISEHRDAEVSHLIEKEKQISERTQINVMPGAVAYAKEIKQQLDIDEPLNRFIARVMQATYDAVTPKNKAIRLVKNGDIQQYVMYKALYKAHKHDKTTKNYGKAKMTGFLINILEKECANAVLTRMLRQAKEPMKFLSVVT